MDTTRRIITKINIGGNEIIREGLWFHENQLTQGRDLYIEVCEKRC